jgi:hypothetical protein
VCIGPHYSEHHRPYLSHQSSCSEGDADAEVGVVVVAVAGILIMNHAHQMEQPDTAHVAFDGDSR